MDNREPTTGEEMQRQQLHTSTVGLSLTQQSDTAAHNNSSYSNSRGDGASWSAFSGSLLQHHGNTRRICITHPPPLQPSTFPAALAAYNIPRCHALTAFHQLAFLPLAASCCDSSILRVTDRPFLMS